MANRDVRLGIEKALSALSMLLLASDDANITSALGVLGKAVDANRAYVFQFRDNLRIMDNTYEWCSPGTKPEIENLQDCASQDFSWWMECLKANRVIAISDIMAMPRTAAAEQQILTQQGIKALLVVPIYYRDGLIGFLGFDDTEKPREWSPNDEYLLRVASDCLAAYFHRQQAANSLAKAARRLRMLNECMLNFGSDVGQNIKSLVAVCGELMDATCALYNEIDGDLLCTMAGWQLPERFSYVDKAEGHICRDIILRESDEVLVVRDLQRNNYAYTDPNVRRYDLQTYIGKSVRRGTSTVGTLCLVFQRDFEPTPEDKELMCIVASAIGSELQRKQAIDSLEKSEQRFRSLIDSMDDVVFTLDKDQRHTGVFGHALDRYGLTREMLIGRTFAEVLGDEADMFYGKANERVLAGENVLYEWSTDFTSDNRHVQVSLSPLRESDGTVTGIVGVVRDITQKKLRERLYDSLADSLPGLVYRVKCDEQLTVDYVHVGRNAPFNWLPKMAIIASGISSLNLVVPEDRDLVREMISALSVDNPSYHITVRIRKQKRIRFFQTMGRAHFGADGRSEALEGIAFDVTERLKEQDQASRVTKMETVGRLAAGVAHDFNNLLQGIVGCACAMQENPSLDDDAHEGLEEILRVSERAADLVQQILTFSRQTPTHVHPTDIAALAKEVTKMLRETLPRTIHIRCKCPLNPLMALADSSKIHQVLLNLCLNARDAMPNGGTLCVAIDEVSLDAEFAKGNPWARAGWFIRCDISDNGCGMDEQTKSRLFEPFFTTKPYNASGLGLATCYGIIQAHNGFFDVESELGIGTTVSVYLPVASRETASTGIQQAQRVPCGSETILLVDDEDYIQRISKRLLEKAGYRVLIASNGREAVETLSETEENIDLVLLDLNMPEMDGIETLSYIRTIRPETKVLVSAGLDTGIEQLPEADQPDGFLQKPYKPDKLYRAIRRTLDLKA